MYAWQELNAAEAAFVAGTGADLPKLRVMALPAGHMDVTAAHIADRHAPWGPAWPRTPGPSWPRFDTTKPTRPRRCATLIYEPLSSERRCNRPAVAILDADMPHAHPICADCARDVRDAARVSPLTDYERTNVTGGNAR